MEVKRVYPSGFCKGVVNAIELVKKTKRENPDEKIYILGMIVHNSHVTRQLEDMGIITLDDSLKSKEELLKEIDEGIVIFTAHGISDRIKKLASDRGLKYVDATCEDVLKTGSLIREYLSKGYEVLYLGKKNHPEAEAILSISPKIHLLTGKDDLKELKVPTDRLILTSQTTMSSLELRDLIEEVKKLYPSILIKNDICFATNARQRAIMELEDCDLLYVVGDVKSNNTNMLKQVAEKSGIKKVRLISDCSEIDDGDLEGANKVYVTAGASTPTELINGTIEYLKNK